MATLDLIDRLALDARPVRAAAGGRDLAVAAASGGLFTFALVLLGYGVQPGLASAPAAEALAMKLAYVGTLGAMAFAGAVALARPGADLPSWRWLLAPVAGLALLAIASLSASPAADWPALLLGGSWARCPWRIAALSLPVAAALALAVRRAAPTDLRRAGAAVGLAAGALAAAIYALACTERSPAFVLVWYSAGVGLSGAIGALAGSRLLRW